MPLTEEEKKARKTTYQREYHKKYYLSNKENIKARASQWFKDNKERDTARAKAYHEANRDKRNNKSRRWSKGNKDKVREYVNRRTVELCDTYVNAHIRRGTSLSAKDIPQELIGLKRQQLILHRTIKEVKKCL